MKLDFLLFVFFFSCLSLNFGVDSSRLVDDDLENPNQTLKRESSRYHFESKCLANCTKFGTCNEELGRCDCPLDRSGADCSTLLSYELSNARCEGLKVLGRCLNPEERCLNDCNFLGICLYGFCKCSPGHFGADCSLSLPPLSSSSLSPSPPLNRRHKHPPSPILLAGSNYRTRSKRPWIYVYELPPHLTTWTSSQALDRPLHAFLYQRLLGSGARISDPNLADWFYIPIRLRLPSDAGILVKAIEYLSRTWPYFRNLRGNRHFVVHVGDTGRSELEGLYGEIFDMGGKYENVTWLTHWGLVRDDNFTGWRESHRIQKDVVIPVAVPDARYKTLQISASPLHPRSPGHKYVGTGFQFYQKDAVQSSAAFLKTRGMAELAPEAYSAELSLFHNLGGYGKRKSSGHNNSNDDDDDEKKSKDDNKNDKDPRLNHTDFSSITPSNSPAPPSPSPSSPPPLPFAAIASLSIANASLKGRVASFPHKNGSRIVILDPESIKWIQDGKIPGWASATSTVPSLSSTTVFVHPNAAAVGSSTPYPSFFSTPPTAAPPPLDLTHHVMLDDIHRRTIQVYFAGRICGDRRHPVPYPFTRSLLGVSLEEALLNRQLPHPEVAAARQNVMALKAADKKAATADQRRRAAARDRAKHAGVAATATANRSSNISHYAGNRSHHGGSISNHGDSISNHGDSISNHSSNIINHSSSNEVMTGPRLPRRFIFSNAVVGEEEDNKDKEGNNGGKNVKEIDVIEKDVGEENDDSTGQKRPQPCSGYHNGYSQGTRQEMYRLFWDRPNYRFRMHDIEVGRFFAASRFCFAPLGGGHGQRQVLVAMMGCVPLLVSDHVLDPFEPAVDWRHFGVKVNKALIPEIPRILNSISEDEFARKQRLLKCFAQHMAYSSSFGGFMNESGRYDAFETILEYLRVLGDHPGLDPSQYMNVDPKFKSFMFCDDSDLVPDSKFGFKVNHANHSRANVDISNIDNNEISYDANINDNSYINESNSIISSNLSSTSAITTTTAIPTFTYPSESKRTNPNAPWIPNPPPRLCSFSDLDPISRRCVVNPTNRAGVASSMPGGAFCHQLKWVEGSETTRRRKEITGGFKASPNKVNVYSIAQCPRPWL